MSKNTTIKPLAVAMGAAFATTLAASPVANAADNPFAMTELPGGYMVADSHAAEGKCGEGMKKDKDMEGKCGEGVKKKEGKCGEGKCGEGMKQGMDEGMKKGMDEGMKKGMEGKCGEGKCGEGVMKKEAE